MCISSMTSRSSLASTCCSMVVMAAKRMTSTGEGADLVPLGRCEGPAPGLDVGADLLGSGRPGDHRRDLGEGEQPGEGQIEDGVTALGRPPLEPLHPVEHLV